MPFAATLGLTFWQSKLISSLMYPFIRAFYHMARARRMPKLTPFETHVSEHICWPWDIDLWMELNNGRTLTLFDMGRLGRFMRDGSREAANDGRFGLAVAGASVRYRKRVTMFQKVKMFTKTVGYDDKFMYMEQSMWNSKGECCNHILLRAAVLKGRKMVPPQKFMDVLDPSFKSPPLPEWVQGWVDADTQRPWPPEKD